MATREEVDQTLGAYEPGPGDPDLAGLMRGHLEASGAGVEPETLRPVTDWFGEPAPAAAIWRDNPNRPDGEAGAGGRDAVASDGEPGILAAPGKSGKSYIALDLALGCGRGGGTRRGVRRCLRVAGAGRWNGDPQLRRSRRADGGPAAGRGAAAGSGHRRG